MPTQAMKRVLVRPTPVEHTLLRTIFKGDGLHLQRFFWQAAKRKIQQRAHALAALEGDDREDA